MPHTAVDKLAASPTLFPLRILREGAEVELLSLTEADYRAASFLDQRMLHQASATQTTSWAMVREAAPLRRTHFIFHVGHCGSTLLSRLLGEHPDLFALREPALLREVAVGATTPEDLRPLLGLYGRVWRPSQTALVKATSFVSDLAPAMMDLADGAALLLGVTPPAYICAILGGASSREESRVLAPQRQARLEHRLGRVLTVDGEGERIALAWLCEAASLQAIAEAMPTRCLQLDFDAVLAQPAAWLHAALVYLGEDPGRVDLDKLVSGPLMRRYSKGPEHAYDAALRRSVLAQAMREEPAAVRAGMAWLQRQGDEDPWVAKVVTASAMTARRSLAPSSGVG